MIFVPDRHYRADSHTINKHKGVSKRRLEVDWPAETLNFDVLFAADSGTSNKT